MSWNNHIDRHGLMAKKTVDGRRWIYLYSSAPRPRPQPDYELTTISHTLPSPGCCGFSHSPYNKKLAYEDDREDTKAQATGEPSPQEQYFVTTTVALLRLGSKTCEFCHILFHGLEQFRDRWQGKWDEYAKQDFMEDHQQDYEWLDDTRFRDDEAAAVANRPVDEAQIYFRFSCPMQGGIVRGQLSIEPRKGTYLTPNNPSPDRVLIVLEYHTLEGDGTTWGAFGPSPQASGDILSESSIKKLTSCIDQCVSMHPNCGPDASKHAGQTKPARLIKTRRTSDSDSPMQLRLEIVDPNKDYKYIALSHCWSQTMRLDNPISTTAENLASRLETMAWQDLPQAFQDTLLLADRLGISYVWIDSLCIMQHDEEDWLAESPKMGAIYEHAHVVFAAHGKDLALRKQIRICSDKAAPKKKIFGQQETDVYVRMQQSHDGFFYPAEDTSSWFGRAWCFQERVFGSRILHFGDEFGEMCFECNEDIYCECGGVDREMSSRRGNTGRALIIPIRHFPESQKGADDQPTSKKTVHGKARLAKALALLPASESEKAVDEEEAKKKQALWQTYLDLCETFTSQGLTKSADTIPALSSLARRICPHLGRYLAGLWEYNILIGLQWESLDGRLSNRHEAGKYVAPTFSWASRTGPVVWYIYEAYLKMDREGCQYAKVVEMGCTPVLESSPFGPVKDGFVTLRGYVVRNMRFEDKSGCYEHGKLLLCRVEELSHAGGRSRAVVRDGKLMFRDLRDDGPGIEYERSCYVCMDTIEDMREARNRQVVCLDIMRDRRQGGWGYSSVLVLVEVEARAGVYRRIGFSTARIGMFRGAQVETVTII